MRLSRFSSRACATAVTVGLLAFYSPHAMAAPSLGDEKGAGERKGASRLKFKAGDSALAQVDVGSGNLLVSVKTLALIGAKGSTVQTGAFYNSASADDIPATERFGAGWGMDLTPSIKLKTYSDGVTYTGPGGLKANFDNVSGSKTAYKSPDGLKGVTLKRLDNDDWEMKDHKSGETQTFNDDGVLEHREDRDDNKTDVDELSTSNGGFKDVSVVSAAGPTAARKEIITTNAAGKTTLTQTVAGGARVVSFTRTNGRMVSYVDALGRETKFSYDSQARMTRIDAPGSVSTAFTYSDTTHAKIASVTQTENASGGPGSSVTRFDYHDDDTTYVADPTTDQNKTVADVAHTTYSLDSDDHVKKSEDAEGRKREKTYTPDFDTASETTAGGKSSKNEFAANSGESLTKSSAAEGSSSSFSYPSTTNGTQYQPTSSKDDAGNNTTFTYSGTGNIASSKNAALAATANLDYNDDGTIKAAKKPSLSSDDSSVTKYAYNDDHQMSTITPPSGSKLGVKTFTYDEYGRQKTATNGRGITQTYGYDKLDRVVLVTFSDGAKVSYAYDAAGRMTTRTDTNGTTTYTYDQLGRLTSRQNTAGGSKFNYKYNRASSLVSTTSAVGGTVTYGYDKAAALTSVTYPNGKGATATTRFSIDSHGRRNQTWFNTDADNKNWTAHMNVDYDDDDHVERVFVEESHQTVPSRIFETDYCYRAGTTGHDCTGGSPRSKLQWKLDRDDTDRWVDYVYDGAGRLTDAKVQDHADYNYTYDKRGNRTDADSQELAFNTDNQIKTSGYTYDAAGNLTAKPGLTSIAYTSADQIKSVVKGGVTYTYKHAGTDQKELLSQTTPKGNYAYAYGRNDPQGRPTIETVTKDGKTANVINDPVTGQPLILRNDTGAPELYVYEGTVGNPIAVVNSEGHRAVAQDFDPYGTAEITSTTEGDPGIVENPFDFAQGVVDRTTGWIHFGNRYFDPTTGTWTQMDTLDTPLDPKNANRYAYAGDDPINNIDPLGKDTANRAGNAFGAFVGGLIGVPVAAVNPIAGGAIGGCVGVSLGNGYENAWRGQGSTVSGLGADCLTGAAIFGAGFGIKKALGFST